MDSVGQAGYKFLEDRALQISVSCEDFSRRRWTCLWLATECPHPICFCRVSKSDSRTEHSILSAVVYIETVPTQAALSKVSLALWSVGASFAQGDIGLQQQSFWS